LPFLTNVDMAKFRLFSIDNFRFSESDDSNRTMTRNSTIEPGNHDVGMISKASAVIYHLDGFGPLPCFYMMAGEEGAQGSNVHKVMTPMHYNIFI